MRLIKRWAFYSGIYGIIIFLCISDMVLMLMALTRREKLELTITVYQQGTRYTIVMVMIEMVNI